MRGAIQADMYLPEGVSITLNNRVRLQASLCPDGPWGENDLTLSINRNGDFYTFIVTSYSGDWLQAGSGKVFEMEVETSEDAEVGPTKVMFKNSLLVTTEGRDIDMDDVEYDAEITASYSVTASSSDDAMGTVEITGGGQAVASGSTVTVTATPADGYDFVNWTASDTEVSTENPYQFIVSENIALVANFKAKMYDVKFVLDNGKEDVVESLEFGAIITAPEIPTKTGYTFGGWDPAFEEGATVPVEGITYTAIWKVNQYTITFDTDGGNEIAPITADYDSDVTAPASPEKTGYTFKGWDKEIPTTMPAEDITVKALWTINQYTITFDTDGGSEVAPITADYDSEVTTPASPTKTGYTFKGWDKEIPAKMPAEDITVKALWTINQYTITFDTDGGSEIAPITADYDSEVTAPAAPTKTGYTFKGWDKEIPAKMPAENLTVKALWEAKQYKLTYIIDDTEYKTLDVDYGTSIEAESDPEKEGYTFSGWTGIPKTMPDHDVTVTGSFTINCYNLSVYLNGELYSTEEVEYGAALNIKNPTVPEGYVFDGWKDAVPETMPAHNVNIYGSYSEDPTSGVEFNFDNESVVTIFTVSGTLICKDKKWSEVAGTIAKGIYIISGKKVIIK